MTNFDRNSNTTIYMKRLLLILILWTVVYCIYAQELKTIKIKNELTVEEYEVLKSDKKIKDGIYLKKTELGQIMVKGQYKNNHKIGIWEFYEYGTGKLEQKYDFDNNRFIFLEIESTIQNHFYYNGEWIIGKLDTVPVIIGGLSNLRIKLSEAVYSDSKAPNFPKAGMSLFTFIVTKEGETKDFKIALANGNSFENKLLKIFKNSTDKWEPAIYKGEKVDSEFLIPLNIRYIEDSDLFKSYVIDFKYPKTN